MHWSGTNIFTTVMQPGQLVFNINSQTKKNNMFYTACEKSMAIDISTYYYSVWYVFSGTYQGSDLFIYLFLFYK